MESGCKGTTRSDLKGKLKSAVRSHTLHTGVKGLNGCGCRTDEAPLTLKVGSVIRIFCPTSLHQAQEALAGVWTASWNGPQVWTNPFHHFHHDLKDVVFSWGGQTAQWWIQTTPHGSGVDSAEHETWRPVLVLSSHVHSCNTLDYITR